MKAHEGEGEAAMRLVLATVARRDLPALLIALVREGFRATVFAAGNPLHDEIGVMIGVQAEAVPDVLAVFERICRPRPRPGLTFVPGLATPPPYDADDAHCARYAVLPVARFERITGQ